MRTTLKSRTATRAVSVASLSLLGAAASFMPMRALAEVTPHESFLAIQRQVETIEPRLIKSTVVIKLYDGSGSGVIISPDGLVLTAGHVVEGRKGRHVTAVLADGRSMPAIVIASDRESDLGIVKIDDASGLTASPLGDSSTLRSGEWVLATGHPLGQHAGRPPVLRIGRVLRAGMGRFGRQSRSISTDAPIISGDSGGPLFDLNGRIVGINSMITTGDRRMMSIHVPVNLAKAAVASVTRGETPDSWDGPPAAFLTSFRQGEAALESGDASTAARLAKVAADADPTSAMARILLAHADAHIGQPQLALAALSQACDRGYNDVAALRKDADFAPLANQPAMERLLEKLDAYSGVPGQRKSDTSLLAPGAPQSLSREVVRIESAGSSVALGTIMSSDGDILTKASELPDGPLTGVLPDGRTVPMMRRGVDSAWDVALLKANAAGLTVPALSEGPVVGEWTFSPDTTGGLGAIGIVGVQDMPVHGRGIAPKPTAKAYMGVQLQPLDRESMRAAGVSHGVAVVVQPDLPAARAGVRDGDIVTEADGFAIADPDTLMDLMVKKSPGDTVHLHLVRGTERISLAVPLTTRPAGLVGRNGLPEMLSGEVSRMQGPFDRVIHHDAVLKPNAMGGPLLDTEGRFIGMNIARADRTSTYAIGARDLRDIYAKLKAAH
jgi:serine protease Do